MSISTSSLWQTRCRRKLVDSDRSHFGRALNSLIILLSSSNDQMSAFDQGTERVGERNASFMECTSLSLTRTSTSPKVEGERGGVPDEGTLPRRHIIFAFYEPDRKYSTNRGNSSQIGTKLRDLAIGRQGRAASLGQQCPQMTQLPGTIACPTSCTGPEINVCRT